LCWQETKYDDLTLDHIVPKSLGGSRTILSCRRCNNDQGRDLDAHLSQHQKITDAIQGHGALKTKLYVNGREIVANLELGEGGMNFIVAGKATNPAAWKAVRDEFACGKVSTIDGTLFAGYRKNNFRTAVLRCAYLAVFEEFGYAYLQHEVVQVLRRRIARPTLRDPNLASLIFEAQNCRLPFDAQHYLVSGNVNGVSFYLAIIRARRATTKYFGAFLPIPGAKSGEFFDLMEKYAAEHNGESLTIPAGAISG
jgi:hypothetical protein